MINTPILLKKLFGKFKLEISTIEPDLECEEYFGYNFQLDTAKVKFRKAKITPKKIGQFVTLWRRNEEGIPEPFNVDDKFDFLIIYVEKDEQKGFFLFPKLVLAEKQILLNGAKDGKRAFRIYPKWDIPENKQAEKTKTWQIEFFIDLNNDENEQQEQFVRLFKGY